MERYVIYVLAKKVRVVSVISPNVDPCLSTAHDTERNASYHQHLASLLWRGEGNLYHSQELRTSSQAAAFAEDP